MVLLFALINFIIYLTIPEGRPDQDTFWIAWAFALPVNFVVAIGLHLYGNRKDAVATIHLPIVYYLIGIFGAIYLVVGAIFMYGQTTENTFLIILEAIISVAYIIASMFFLFGANYMAKKEVKRKVLFIKVLQIEIESCIQKTKNSEVITALNKFKEDVRFSDPMSHVSLEKMEKEILSTISEISIKLEEENDQEALELIKNGQSLLKTRNAHCLALK